MESLSEVDSKYTQHLEEAMLARASCSIFKPRPRQQGGLRVPASRVDADAQLLCTLSAPSLIQNYYFNVLEFTADGHLLCALGSRLLAYHPQRRSSTFCGADLNACLNYIRAHPAESLAALATTKGNTLLTSLETGRVLQQLPTQSRATVLDWRGALLAQGDRCGYVSLFDIRQKPRDPRQVKAHVNDVCALRFSPFNDDLLMTGGMDKCFRVFDLRALRSTFWSTYHCESVKAVAWSPFTRGLLATGAGTGDERIALWDVKAQSRLRSKMTHTQVCNLHFLSPRTVVSTFGWPTYDIQFRDNHLRLSRSVKEHRNRVLYLALDRTNSLMATGSADKKIKLWAVESAGKGTCPSPRCLREAALR